MDVNLPRTQRKNRSADREFAASRTSYFFVLQHPTEAYIAIHPGGYYGGINLGAMRRKISGLDVSSVRIQLLAR